MVSLYLLIQWLVGLIDESNITLKQKLLGSTAKVGSREIFHLAPVR